MAMMATIGMKNEYVSIRCYSMGIWEVGARARTIAAGPPFATAAGPASAIGREQRAGIYRLDALANLEMKLGPVDAATVAGRPDHLSFSNFLSACDGDVFRVRVGGDKAIRVRDENEIAVTAQRTRIAHGPIGCGPKWRAKFGSNVDAVVSRPMLAGS